MNCKDVWAYGLQNLNKHYYYRAIDNMFQQFTDYTGQG